MADFFDFTEQPRKRRRTMSNDDINNQEMIMSLDDDDNDDNDVKQYSNIAGFVVEQIKDKGYAKMDYNVITKQCNLMVIGYLRNQYDIDEVLPASVIEICQNYFPKSNLFCQNLNYISLRAGDVKSDTFVISKEYCFLSKFIFSCSETTSTEIIHIKQVPSETLDLTLQYLAHHKGRKPDPLPCPIRSIDMSQICSDKWDADWMDKFEKKTIFEIILCANYLDIHSLVCLGSAKIATLIKQLDQSEINRIIEEEERYRREQAEAKNNETDDDDDDDNDIDDDNGDESDDNGDNGGGLDDDDDNNDAIDGDDANDNGVDGNNDINADVVDDIDNNNDDNVDDIDDFDDEDGSDDIDL